MTPRQVDVLYGLVLLALVVACVIVMRVFG